MQKEIIDKIAERLGDKLESGGTYVQFNDSKYKPIEFSEKNFKNIEGNADNSKIVFLDGGNNSILESSNFSLQLLRTYSVSYKGQAKIKSEKKEFFVLITSSNMGDELIYDVDVFGSEESFDSFNSFDDSISKGKHRADISEIGSACRKLFEIRKAIELVDELKENDVIALDRDLKASLTGEKDLLDELYEKAYQKKVIVCGLTKTTRMFTETGDSAVAFINSIAPEGEWFYWPLAEIKNENHKAEIFFVKLHKKSRYVFRFEIFNKQKDKIMKVMNLLKNNSCDPVFLGYPYGLVLADKLARVSNKESEYYKVMLMSKSGKNKEKIFNYMKSVDAHSVLDSIN